MRIRPWAVGALVAALLIGCAGLVACGTSLFLPGEISTRTHLLCVAQGGAKPTAKDFLPEATVAYCQTNGIDVFFTDEVDFDTLGQATADLTLRDGRGRTRCISAQYRVVQDETPPVITGVSDRAVLLGEGAVLRQGVEAFDDCFGEVTLEVDASMLDTLREGYYSVSYIARDAVGNETRQTAYVSVYAMEVSQGQLWAACDEYLADILLPGMTKEQVCRSIFAAVQRDVEYSPLGDKTDWVRVAYEALFVRHRGDCFAYFSAAKALLTRAGIECLEIKRSHLVQGETHYWLMVNLAEQGQADRWYHFDVTELSRTDFSHDGCLFTDAELDAYNEYREGFYDYDRAAYPPTSEESLRQGWKK